MKHILNIKEFYLNETNMKLLYIKCYENSFFEKQLIVEKRLMKNFRKKLLILLKTTSLK